MDAQTLSNLLVSLFPTRRTLCIEGAPGGGKTTVVRDAAASLNIPVVELHMPTMLVEDFGVLYPDAADTGTLSYRLPHWFPDADNPDTPAEGILLFDDRNQASPDLQKVLANICQARTLHGHRLPDGWQVISTGNRQSDRAGANRVLSHLRNRETVVSLDTSVEAWTKWALSHDIRAEVVAFVNFRPDLLHNFDPAKEANPTPRSWAEGVSALMGVIPQAAEYECFAGAVGEAAATEFVGFLRTWRELPDPKAVLKDPEAAPVPTAPDVLYALGGALSQHVDYSTMDAFVKYIDRIPLEFATLAVNLTNRRNAMLVESGKRPAEESTSRHPAFQKWAFAHAEVIFAK